MNKKEKVINKLKSMSISELEKTADLYKIYLKAIENNNNKELIEALKNYEKE